MLSSFDSVMRKILLLSARKLALMLGFFLTILLFILMLVLWNVTSNISSGSTRYLEEIGLRLANSMVSSVEGSALALSAISTSLEHNRIFHSKDFRRIYNRLALEDLITIDLYGRGHDLQGNSYNFSGNERIMRAVNGKVVVFDCTDIHAQDGTDPQKNHLALAVPSYRDNEPYGAIIADVGERWGNNFLNTVLMQGGISFTIFDDKGHMLIKSADFLMETPQPSSGSTDQCMFDGEHTSLLECRIKELLEHPVEKVVHFNYALNNTLHRAVLVPIREYNVFLLAISPGNLGIKEFVSIDRTITVTLTLLVVLLTSLCVMLAIFYHYCRTMAFTDPVTGGMTQMRFELEFEDKLSRALPGQYSFFAININKFKLFNDFFGRSEGDRLLRIFYTRLESELQISNMLLCRSGVDEFDLLVANTTVDNVVKTLDRAVTGTMAKLTAKNDTLDYTFSVRVGALTIREPKSGYVSIKDLAGIAMERAERTYSNNLRYGIFEDEEIQRARRERSIENSMQQSLDNEDFYIMLQPKVVLLTGAICGAEALVRWHHPQLGQIYPNEFVPLFERNGFITKLDLWVFRKVCELMQSWMKHGYPLVPVSVNLSRVDIDHRANLVDELAKIADSCGVPREYLDLEVTETVFYKDSAFIQKTVDTLRAKGFKCSLDDFGSGFSSLNLLPDLRVDTIKIDKSFFASQELNRGRDRLVIKKVVELAQELGMKVVAEGVETEAQKDFLCKCSCTMGQGYLFSKPVLTDEFERKAFGDTQNQS